MHFMLGRHGEAGGLGGFEKENPMTHDKFVSALVPLVESL